MSLVHLTEKNFESEVTKSQLPVLVDFWAEWCGPCRMIGPVVEQMAKDYHGKLKVAKLNVDEAQDLAIKYGVMSIPTIIVFKNGKPVDQVVGAMDKEQLVNRLKGNWE